MSFLSDAAQDSGASPPGAAPREKKQSSPLDVLRDAIRRQHPELPENVQMKMGGAVKAKGWGKARSARGAKVY